jgi:hypothetical protein
MSNKRRKFSKGDAVKYRGQKWTICKGGRSNPSAKTYEYKISRGAWKRHVAGRSLTKFED